MTTTTRGGGGGEMDDSALINYASHSCSYQPCHTHFTQPGLFATLMQFLATKTLVQIETVPERVSSAPTSRSGRDLKPYLAGQLEEKPPFDTSYQTVSSWIPSLPPARL